MSHHTVRRLVAPVATCALALTVLAPTGAQAVPPASEGARDASTWLATQLTDGVVHNDAWGSDDYGMTLDIGLSLDEVGGDAGMVRQIRQAMSSRIDSYVTGADFGAPDERYSGAMAKSLVFADVSGADPRSYGGRDLVAETEALVITDGPSTGRLQDLSEYGDYANTFGQALAARGLHEAGSPLADEVTDYLLEQQCDAGYFRVFFDADKDAAEQGCVDGDEDSPTDTDATAMALSQLAAIDQPTAQVRAALRRGADWLVSTQRADGSFVGSAFTPDPNANSTGLAASALASTGRCLPAGRAADWVASVQVGPQSAGSPLAGEEGAIAYSADALSAAKQDGIGATRDQWRRATVQSVAGLTHRLGSTAGLTLSAPRSGTPASTVTVTGSGGRQGDRYCLAGPGVDGHRTVVVRSDGTFATEVTLPATDGTASWSVTGRDGVTQVAVPVRSAGSPALASVAGVRLVAPRGPQAARDRVALRVRGAAAGAAYTLTGGGTEARVVAGSDGSLSRVVRLPRVSRKVTYRLSGSDGVARARVTVFRPVTLRVRTARRVVAAGDRQVVVVRRLEKRERVTVEVAGRTVGRARGNRKGRARVAFTVPRLRGRVVVRVEGALPATRHGKTVFRIR